MEVQIIATHECRHRLDLQRELLDLEVPFDLLFVEDNQDLVRRYQIRHSPNLVIDGVVVFRGQPTEGQLRAVFAKPAEGAMNRQCLVSVPRIIRTDGKED